MLGKLFVFLVIVAVLSAFGALLFLLGVPSPVIAFAALVVGLTVGIFIGVMLSVEPREEPPVIDPASNVVRFG